MAQRLHLVPAPAGQFCLCCPSCGAAAQRAGGFCAPCAAARRRDFSYFGGFRRRVLERDCHRCRVCGEGESARRRLHVHHRRPGVSRETLLLALCPACHARAHRPRALDHRLPALARALWRELHPGGPEQLVLDFAAAGAAPAQAPAAWLWEDYRAG